ncbi:hypothetical protein WSS15_23840 [Acetobacter pasteurianus]|uniref:phage baseplate plug family protein n=1 Tax=Acetobacter pasteurianus TaxID=438 RepID=UPI0022BBB575|nr:hypothetical protein [Acetobacter pasteurianus]GLH29734.1 hypothetical protein WSS15_23840 [Acetobacter pasteurianus]
MSSAYTIPLNAVAFQKVQTPLSGQTIRFDIQQRSTGLYANIWLNGAMKMAGVLCQDRTWLVREAYFGFPGDFTFVDTQGTSDPEYSALGTRYLLVYQEGQNV